MLIVNVVLAIIVAHVVSFAIPYFVTLGSTFMGSFSVALFAVSAIMLIAGGLFGTLFSQTLVYGSRQNPRVRTRDPNDEVEEKKTGRGAVFLIAGGVVFLESLALAMIVF